MTKVSHIQGLATEALDFTGLRPPADCVRGALEGTAEMEGFIETFETGVMGFTVEAEVRDSIRRRISGLYDETVEVVGSVQSVPAEYKTPYARGMCRRTTTDAVRTEVNIGNSSAFDGLELKNNNGLCDFTRDGSGGINKNVDIAVLREGDYPHPVFGEATDFCRQIDRRRGSEDAQDDAIEVAIAGGSKYFPPLSIEVAVEVKYVKDKTSASLEGGMWRKVASDIEKLQELSRTCRAAGAPPPETHLVIVSNYDPFRLRPHRADDDEEKSRDQSRYDPDYPSRFVSLAETCAERGVHLWACAPEKEYLTSAGPTGPVDG